MSKLTDSGISQTHTKTGYKFVVNPRCIKSPTLPFCLHVATKSRKRGTELQSAGWSVPPLVLHALAPASGSSRPPTNVFLLLDRQRTAPAPAHLWSVCVVLCSQCLFVWGLCGSQSDFFCVSLGTRPHIAAFLIHIKVMNKKWMFIKIHTCKP